MKLNLQNTKYKIPNIEHAITLLALIITVIILLILATVSISLIINSGILDHAQQGVDRYSEEEELEQIKLAVASARLKENGFLTTENLNSELQDKFGENAVKVTELQTKYIIDFINGKSYLFNPETQQFKEYKGKPEQDIFITTKEIKSRYIFDPSQIVVNKEVAYLTNNYTAGYKVYEAAITYPRATYILVGNTNWGPGYLEYYEGYNICAVIFDSNGNVEDVIPAHYKDAQAHNNDTYVIDMSLYNDPSTIQFCNNSSMVLKAVAD